MKKFKIIGTFHQIIQGMLLSYYVAGKTDVDIEAEYRLIAWKPYALLTLKGTDVAVMTTHHAIEEMYEQRGIMSYPV